MLKQVQHDVYILYGSKKIPPKVLIGGFSIVKIRIIERKCKEWILRNIS